MRMKSLLASVYALYCLFAGAAFASEVLVSDAWTRATAPGQSVAGVYFGIRSDTDAVLTGAETAAAGVTELHFMRMEDGVMRMRSLPSVELPAGETVQFKPGGLHVMLFELKQPLKAGEELDLVLIVEDGAGHRSRVGVQAQVRNLDGSKVHQH